MKFAAPFAALAFVLLQLGAFSTAQAQVTFEDAASTGFTTSPITSQQLTFTSDFYQIVGDASTLSALSPITGDGKFLAYNSAGGVGESFASTTSAPFNLLSLDLAGWYNFGPGAQNVTITGVRADSSVVSSTVSVLSGSFSHYALSGFTHLTAVNLVHAGADGSSYYVGVDNILVTAVPEPTTWAMLLGGLVLLGYSKRRSFARA